MNPGDTSIGGSRGSFPQTTLGLFSRLGSPSAEEQRAAFEALCQRYWRPIYRYLRRAKAKSNEDAKDLTQAFFTWLFEEEVLKGYQSERGSFRGFLKLLLGRFTINADKAVSRLKRGGGQRRVDMDGAWGNVGDIVADPQAASPEQEFDREWLRTMLEQAVERVHQKLASSGREAWFRAYEAYHREASAGEETYAEVAGRLQMKEQDVRRYLFIVRQAIRDELRMELFQLTTDPKALEEEWKELFGG